MNNGLTEEQIHRWVLGLMQRAEELSELLDLECIPSIKVAELTGYAKSSLILLSSKQAAEYHKRTKLSGEHKALAGASTSPPPPIDKGETK